MGYHPTCRSRSWKPPSLKNARSFLIKLIHLHPTPPHKADEPPQEDQTTQDELEQDGAQDLRINSLPPTYEVALQTPSQSSHHGHGQSEDLENLMRPSTIIKRSTVMVDTSCTSSSSNLPLSTIQSTSLLPTSHHPEQLEEIESLEDPRLLRPSPSQQSCSSNHSRLNKRPITHKSMKASSTNTLSSQPTIHNPRSGSRRDRELIAAKKSLPVLTKFGKPSATPKNVPLI